MVVRLWFEHRQVWVDFWQLFFCEADSYMEPYSLGLCPVSDQDTVEAL